jgi:maltoporin
MDALARLVSDRGGVRRRAGARTGWWLAGAAALCALAPREAAADLPSDRVDFAMYGRVGIAWTLSGQVISGTNMNLGDKKALGGRFEEGDYLEPAIKTHILKAEHEGDTKVDMVMTFGMFARNGSFIDALASNTSEALGIEMFQAFLEAQNVFTKDLTFWAGARQYRGSDIHIADIFYFNDLSGQGAGIKYKGLDTAVLLQTNGTDLFYNADLNGDDELDVKRQRTIVVAQYTYPFGPGSTSVQGLGELHVVPASRKGQGPAIDGQNPSDFGWVAGAKLHLDLDNGAFNDASVRYGQRIANGGWGGTQTFYTFGDPATDGTYDGAFGLEVVDHFLWNFNPTLTVNAYGILGMSQGASGSDDDKRLNFAVGARTFLYAHRNFHMINELTFQGRRDGTQDMGTAVKVSVVPTIVPTGERSAWARPHLRLIYTAGFYNDAAADQLMSPYLQTVGRTKVGHFIGTRAEWWF